MTPPRPSGGVPQGGKGVHRTLSRDWRRNTTAGAAGRAAGGGQASGDHDQSRRANGCAGWRFVGGVQAGYPIAYQRELQDLSAALGIEDRCAFTGNLPPDEVREWNRRATIAVNTSPVGLFDKSALESMACGCANGGLQSGLRAAVGGLSRFAADRWPGRCRWLARSAGALAGTACTRARANRPNLARGCAARAQSGALD